MMELAEPVEGADLWHTGTIRSPCDETRRITMKKDMAQRSGY